MKKTFLILSLIINLSYCEIYDYEYLLYKAKTDSPSLNIKRVDIFDAKEDVNLKEANFYPSLALSATSQYQDTFDKYYNSIYVGNQGLPTNTSYQNSASIILRYDIFTFGKDTLELKAAKESVISSKFDKCSYEVELSLDILNEYEKALNIKNELEIYTKLKEAYNKLHSYSKALFKSGEIDAIKVNDYELSLLNATSKIKELSLEAKTTLSTLTMLSGVKLNSLNEIASFSDEIGKFSFTNFENTHKAKFIDSQIKTSNLMADSLEKAYYPTISLYARYDFYGNDRDKLTKAYKDIDRHGYEVGITFTWELFDGGKRRANLNKERLKAKRLEYEKTKAKLEYEKQVSDLFAFLEEKDDTKKLLAKATKTSNQTTSNINALYKSGERNKLEILESLVVSLQRELELKNHIIKSQSNNKLATILSSQSMCEEDKVEWWE
ncbi:MAG: TolC family protein [Campylobacter sp.]|nr:TolC family protein [Campylobacter sp.]